MNARRRVDWPLILRADEPRPALRGGGTRAGVSQLAAAFQELSSYSNPDDVFGEIGWAYVVPRDPADPPALAELRAFVGAELASFKRPDGVSVLAELPLTPMFKVDKRALAARGRG